MTDVRPSTTRPITTGEVPGAAGAAVRIEHDSMGDVAVPAAALWQAQTQRAIGNFPVSGEPMPEELLRALAALKGCAAVVNGRKRIIPKAVAEAVHDAASDVARGRHLDQFPIDVFQTGSGTSTNMNMNEVLATLATRRLHETGDDTRVHPNDHVNASQSSNDMFPSAIHLAAVRESSVVLLPALDHLAAALRRAQRRFRTVVKSGRTHLMDATPVTLGQEFGGYATQIELAHERITGTLPRVGELPLGGTAVGTGINCPPGFARAVIERLAVDTGLALREARDHFEAQGARDSLVELSGQLRVLAVSLVKIATDIRWMGSGPGAGLAELHLPDLQPGSSIMPGKVNPVIPEVVHQVAAQVVGNDATIAFAGAAGNFELNVMLPVIARNLLESIRLLASSTRLLADRCIDGIEADVDRCRHYALSSPALATALNPSIGYEAAASVVKEALATGRTVRDVVIDRGLLSPSDVDAVLDPLALARVKGRRT